MTTSSLMRKSEVGEVRPSQTLMTYGIGSLVDLPNMSVIVMGLDDWPNAHSNEKRKVLRPTGLMKLGRSACRSLPFHAGWSAQSAGYWPRSAPGSSRRRFIRIGPIERATSIRGGSTRACCTCTKSGQAVRLWMWRLSAMGAKPAGGWVKRSARTTAQQCQPAGDDGRNCATSIPMDATRFM